MHHRLKLSNIRAAARVIDPVFLNSPQYPSESLSSALGFRVVVKVETANPVRCFKGRGAEFLAARIPAGTSLITASAGNFGQALAYACRRRRLPLTVYASVNASRVKLDRIRTEGATVMLRGEDFDAAKLEARRAAHESGRRMVEDSLDPETGEGAGTIGLELDTLTERIDAVLLALGNGALACGVGRYLKHARPKTRIIAIQAKGAPAMLESWRRKRLVRFDSLSSASGTWTESLTKESSCKTRH